MSAKISGVKVSPTHDGEGAFVIELTFANGGMSRVQITGAEAADVMKAAGVATASDLVGKPWTVLKVRNPAFMG